ncbi:MAG: hypothetical protein PWP43_1324, partial [Bacillota bacterium]|nr:hypothetical protein [Bacillota bacterium]
MFRRNRLGLALLTAGVVLVAL